jgi:uncharacterized protein (DUF2062 family)
MYTKLTIAALAVAGLAGVVVGTNLGWLGAFSDASNQLYQVLYGQPPAHPNGNALELLTDWLAFLSRDPELRVPIFCGCVVALLALDLAVHVLWVSIARFQQQRMQARSARLRTPHALWMA